jgi:hypothetical protein
VATEAAWLDGNNLEKEEIKKRKENNKNERKALTLTGQLMEGVGRRGQFCRVLQTLDLTPLVAN